MRLDVWAITRVVCVGVMRRRVHIQSVTAAVLQPTGWQDMLHVLASGLIHPRDRLSDRRSARLGLVVLQRLHIARSQSTVIKRY